MTTLTEKQFSALEADMNAIRDKALADLGQRDASYIRGVIRLQRGSEIAGRILLMFGIHPVLWLAGVGLLSLSKILDNMEIGHNVMHGQYDWMNDPAIHSSQFEWDTACDGESWKRTHNYEHHTYTNILGKDRDYGYDVLRLTHEEPWRLPHLFQFGYYLLLSLFFQWGVALHELGAQDLRTGKAKLKDKLPFLKALARKGGRQALKDYVLFPLLAGPMAIPVLAGNIVANLVRNLWSSTVIFCGHFPEDVQTFSEEECKNESKGHWYYRQMLGSANFTGGRWLHVLSGNLSFQIEHHLFPDIPAHRYAELSPQVAAVARKYGLPYNSHSFWHQYRTVLERILKHSLPESKKPPEKPIVAG